MSPLALSLTFLQTQPDSRLVALAREGHEPAFEALVRRYRKELLAYCRRVQPHLGSAEDVFQQSLLQAWRSLKSGAEVRDVRPWLYRIAHNVAASSLRRSVATPHEIEETAGGPEVDQLVEQRLEARAALAAMASLPVLQRQVFVTTALAGASHDEVASALGLSSSAVRGLVYRARTSLRAAAAALTPGPLLGWALRRAETRGGGPSVIADALASGGAAGVAGLVAKGGAVLAMVGALAGAGVSIFPRAPAPHLGSVRVDHGVAAAAKPQFDSAIAALRRDSTAAGGADAVGAGRATGGTAASTLPGHDGRSGTSDRGGSGSGFTGGTSDGHDGGSSGGPGGGSSGGPGGDSSGSSGGGSDGSSSSGGSLSSGTPGSGGGSSGGGPGPSSSGGQITTVDARSGSTEGSSGGSGGSGSGTTTASGPY